MKLKKKLIQQKSSSSSSPDSSESSEVNLAVKDMKFRNRRGERIQQLIQKNEMYENQEDEDFWNNNKYFNNIEKDDNESFQLEEVGDQKMDSYDSDFGKEDDSAAASSSSADQDPDKKVEVRKKIKKVHHHRSLEELTKEKKEDSQEGKKYYIHEFYTQEELLKEAVETEIKNKQSLDSLIMLEEERKKFSMKHRQEIDGTYLKLVYSNCAPTDYKDFDDRPYTKTKCVAKIINQQNGEMDFFAHLNTPFKVNTMQKYRDPLTRQSYNTIEEFKKIRRAHLAKHKIKLQSQIQQYENI